MTICGDQFGSEEAVAEPHAIASDSANPRLAPDHGEPGLIKKLRPGTPLLGHLGGGMYALPCGG
jgi:hypothetical protein